jgi:hypothetical protein
LAEDSYNWVEKTLKPTHRCERCGDLMIAGTEEQMTQSWPHQWPSLRTLEHNNHSLYVRSRSGRWDWLPNCGGRCVPLGAADGA